MNAPTMVYKYPGKHALQDGSYDYQIVDADDVEAAIDDGWSRTPAEAKAKDVPKDEPKTDSPPTRAELEQKATELGLKFDGRTTDKKLAESIAAALKA